MQFKKQLITVLLALALVFTGSALSLPSFADDAVPTVYTITDPDNVSSINYKGSPDTGYIYLRLLLGGENLDKLTKSDFEFTMDGEKIDLDDSSEYSWENQFDIYSSDATSAEVHITFPENELEQERECTITVLCAAEGTEGRVRTLTMAAKPESTEDKFQISTNRWSASDLGNATVRVHIDEPQGVRLRVSPSDYKHYEDFFAEIKDYIYFSNVPGAGADERRYLTVDDKVDVDNGDIIVSLAGSETSLPYYINFAKGALVNAEGKTLGYDEYKRDHNRYIITGAHIDTISYNRITFTHEGGEVTARVTGTMLNSSTDSVSGKIFVDGSRESSGEIVPEISVAEDGKSAEFRFTLPENTGDKTVSYRLTPVINGTNTVPQYIKGYDVLSVLPEGASESDVTLSSVEIQGAYDMDDALDVFKTSTSSEQFTAKIDAVIRGTNLSSKRTLVKAVDENGITWPMLPVFECGATIRWQSSAYYLPEKESKNEQHIELLLPRRLGVTRTFTLYFAPDGQNYVDPVTATVIVENEGLFDTDAIGSGLFTEDDFCKVNDIEVRYVDEEGNELAESDHYKGYGITELYPLGIEPKEVEGYKVKSTTPANLGQMLAKPRQHESGEYIFDEGQWFVKHLGGSPIVYTYEKNDKPQDDPAPAVKKSQNLKVKNYVRSIKASSLRKSKRIVKAIYVSGYRGKLSFSKVSGSKRITVSSKTGKLTVKKGTRRGTYKVRVKVKASGNASYKAASKTVTVKIKVK